MTFLSSPAMRPCADVAGDVGHDAGHLKLVDTGYLEGVLNALRVGVHDREAARHGLAGAASNCGADIRDAGDDGIAVPARTDGGVHRTAVRALRVGKDAVNEAQVPGRPNDAGDCRPLLQLRLPDLLGLVSLHAEVLRHGPASISSG